MREQVWLWHGGIIKDEQVIPSQTEDGLKINTLAYNQVFENNFKQLCKNTSFLMQNMNCTYIKYYLAMQEKT